MQYFLHPTLFRKHFQNVIIFLSSCFVKYSSQWNIWNTTKNCTFLVIHFMVWNFRRQTVRRKAVESFIYVSCEVPASLSPPPDTKCNQTPPSNFKAVGCCGQTYWWTGTVFHICFYVVQWKHERLTAKTRAPPLCESHTPFSDLMRTVDLNRDYKKKHETEFSSNVSYPCLIRSLAGGFFSYWGQYI